MSLFDFVYKPVAKATAEYLLAKAKTSTTEKANGTPMPMVLRSQYDANTLEPSLRRKPESSVSFETLRRFSITHDISRMCINARKRQISSLDWEVIPVDVHDKTDYSKDINLIKAYFKNIGGYRVRFREFQDAFLEDLLVIDGAVLFKQQNSRGDILYYMNVDAATIKLRVDESGNTPMPPEPAYVQYIRGQKINEYTADQMIYEMMNPRTDTPYGLSPLESLILNVSGALKASLYNLEFLTEGNIPEGFLSLPQDWTLNQIKEYMEYFDALVAGNTEQTTKMKPIPGGSTFIPTKKRDDMAFKEFNEWLMLVTCGMFDVQPQEIGFSMNVNKANGTEQNAIGQRRGMIPTCKLLQEVFDDIIQVDLGFPRLRFHYLGLEDKDELLDAQTKAARLAAGIVTIDEVRKEEGLQPIGIDRPYVVGMVTFLTDAVVNPSDEQEINEEGDDVTPPEAHGDTTQESGDSQLIPGEDPSYDPAAPDKAYTITDELKRLEKYAIKRIKLGKSVRPFESDVLGTDITNHLNEQLARCMTADQVKAVIKHAESPHFLAKASDEASTDQDFEDNPHFKQLVDTAGFLAFAKHFRDAIMAQAVWTSKQLKEIESKLLNVDAVGMTNAQRTQVINYLSDSMPVIADKVTTDEVVGWYKEVTNTAVNSLYEALGSSVQFDLTNEAELQALKARAVKLLTKSTLDNTTKKKLAQLIVQDREDGMTIADIKQDILDNFSNISSVRAQMIAHTETVNLMNEQQYSAMQRAGVLMKAWINYGSNPCPVCLGNAGDGFIPMAATFSSGDLMPSAHTGCECGLDYATQEVSLADLWNGE